MRALAVVVGLVLLIATGYDVIRTVFDVGTRAGPLTGRATRVLWEAVRSLRTRGVSHRVLEAVGINIVISVVAAWILGFWLSWTLIFLGSDRAVVSSMDGRPATLWERAYFTGGGLFSLTIGDFRPDSTGWRLAAGALVASGLGLVTLSITFLVPVVAAAGERRHVATYISSLGGSPEEIVLSNWNGTSLREFYDHLLNLMPLLTDLAQKHYAYPVLHYFHSSNRDSAIAPNLAALDEAMTIVEHGIGEDVQLPGCMRAARRAVNLFIDTLHLYPSGNGENPMAPRLTRLREAGVPVVDDLEFLQALNGLIGRRQLLLATVREDGWDWGDVMGGDPVSAPTP